MPKIHFHTYKYTTIYSTFPILVYRLSPSDAPLPATIGVSWKSVLSPMILFGGSAIPLYTAAIIRIFLDEKREKICSAIVSSVLLC